MISTKSMNLRAVVFVIACTAAAIAIALVAFEAPSAHLSSVFAIAILGVLAAMAVNLDVETRSGLGTSGDVMVFLAAIVVFQQQGFFVGAALVGLFGGFDFVQIEKREWAKICLNAGNHCLALLFSTGVFWLFLSFAGTDMIFMLVGICLSATSYVFINSAIVSLPVSISCGESYRSVLRQLIPLGVGVYPFAVLGLGLGVVYLDLGALLMPLVVVPILIARQAFASFLELKAAQEQTIETLIRALEAKDQYTAGHAHRVATFAAYIAEEFTFTARRSERLRYAALMHDIGKLIVPNQLLNKPGRLTEAEFDRVRLHETVSVELLRRIDFLAPVAGDTTTEAATAAVGGGGLIEPAIIHVADAFDAMTSTRSYRKALSQEIAFGELRKGAGTQFNASCVDALISAIVRRAEVYGAGHEVDEHEWAVAPPEAGTGSAGLGNLVPEEQGAPQ